MSVVDISVLTNLSVDAETRRKQIPEIDAAGSRNGFDSCPINLIAERAEKNNGSRPPPWG